MNISWIQGQADLAAVAVFFADNIEGDAAYISHGEVQGGLSLDAKTWAPDLRERFLEDISDMADGQMIAAMRDDAGEMTSAALVQWVDTPRVRFGVIEDLAVPQAFRSQGLGARMVEWIEAEAVKRNCRWLFLESGKNNLRAHRFFERHGFREMSHVFIKPVGAEG